MTVAKPLPPFASLRRVLAAGLGLALLVVGFALFMHYYDPAIDSHPGNPRSAPMTTAQLREIQAASADDRHLKRELADRVIAGDITFEQAGCLYRRGDGLPTDSCNDKEGPAQ
jgi:hypothetical protein